VKLGRACIPLDALWFSPFARWQGPLAGVSSLDLAVDVTTRALRRAQIDPASSFDQIVLGMTIPQETSFYAPPTVAARIGATGVAGPAIAQACATSAACVAAAVSAVDHGDDAVLVVTTDRTSNGPLLLYPRADAPGGAPASEHWVLDNFKRDPWAGSSMLQTAECVAREASIGRGAIDDVVALRHAQYADAEARDAVREARVPVDVRAGKKHVALERDHGVRSTPRNELAALPPAAEGGVVSYAAQTHPADGTAGAVVCSASAAPRFRRGRPLAHVVAYGMARVEAGRMPKAPVAAARRALADAGIAFDALDAVTTHNPFAVNDVYFSRETGVPLERMNAYGCSLVWGHPQGPTGLRALAELALVLEHRGGGVGLFTGCAAGDVGAAVVIRVDG